MVQADTNDSLTLSYLTILNSIPIIKYALLINKDLTTSPLVFGNISTIHANTIQSTEHLVSILNELADTTVCTGNYDNVFINIISEKGGVLRSKTGKLCR